MKGRKLKFIAIALSLSAFGMPAAQAEYVPAETPLYAGVPLDCLVRGAPATSIDTTRVVWGSSLKVHALSFATPGQLTIRLADIEWPEALKSLDLLVTDLQNIWEMREGNANLTLDLGGPAQLFVAVFAKSEDRYTPGLYRLTADFAPVPLPAAAWLLLSGLSGLAFFRRKTVTA